MGKSLFGQLKGMLSREKKSSIAAPATHPNAGSNLSRIGLAGGAAVMSGASQPPMPDFNPAPSVDMGMPSHEAMPGFGSGPILPVGIQFQAEVPLRQSAEEIVNVSRRASNCIDASLQQAGDGKWNVMVTLSMQPVPQHIHEVETVMAEWAGKLGGASRGWGLAQGRAA